MSVVERSREEVGGVTLVLPSETRASSEEAFLHRLRGSKKVGSVGALGLHPPPLLGPTVQSGDDVEFCHPA